MKRQLSNFIKSMLRRVKLKVIKSIVHYFPNFSKAIAHHEQSTINHIDIVHHALSFSCDPIATLNFLNETSLYSESVLWAGLVKASENNHSFITFLYEERAHITDRELRLKVEIKGLLEKDSVSANEINKAILSYKDIIIRPGKPSNLIYMMSALIANKAPVENVDSFLLEINFRHSDLTDFLKVKLLRRAQQEGEKEIYRQWENKLLPSLPEPARLKVLLMKATIDNNKEYDFSFFEKKFSSLPFDVSEVYKKEISILYKKIEKNDNYLDARFDQNKRAILQKTVIDTVASGRSLSYIRLGDGECYGFPDNTNVDEQGVIRQEKHWWGEQLDHSLRQKIKSQFMKSIASADIIGVPTVLRLIKDFSITKRDEYPVNSLISRIICVMKASSPYLKKKKIVEDQSNLFLFEPEFIDRLFSVADKVCVVSGIKSKLIEAWAPEPSKLQCVEIPTHRLLRDGSVGSQTQGVLPHVYEKYMESIRAHAGERVVFLVSAGFIGKIFIAEAAGHGAVALDIGQALVSLADKKGERE
ncbi:hypothetical protein V6R97_12180 [Chromohalobacter salexigens]|uniref:hypothetical protein n=1 Tax=Chromohalobacter israelensis TaxID=141390 RepID=UPI0032E9166D